MRGRRGDPTRGLGTHPVMGRRTTRVLSVPETSFEFIRRGAAQHAFGGGDGPPREADLERNIPCAGSMIVASRPPGGGAPDNVESNGARHSRVAQETDSSAR